MKLSWPYTPETFLEFAKVYLANLLDTAETTGYKQSILTFAKDYEDALKIGGPTHILKSYDRAPTGLFTMLLKAHYGEALAPISACWEAGETFTKDSSLKFWAHLFQNMLSHVTNVFESMPEDAGQKVYESFYPKFPSKGSLPDFGGSRLTGAVFVSAALGYLAAVMADEKVLKQILEEAWTLSDISINQVTFDPVV
jgi:hypothetical protein